MDMNSFCEQIVLYHLDLWKRDGAMFSRRDYTITIGHDDNTSVKIMWAGDAGWYGVPYQRAIPLIDGINRHLARLDRADANSARGGRPPHEPLTLVRDIGFNNIMGVGRDSTEEIVFYGPQLVYGRSESQHATEEACEEYIRHLEFKAQVVRDYLANERNGKTHEWRVRSADDARDRTDSPTKESMAEIQERIESLLPGLFVKTK